METNDTSATETSETNADQQPQTQPEDTSAETDAGESANTQPDASASGDKPAEDTAPTKGAQAFAAMRAENTQLKNLIKRVAATLGVGDLKGDELNKALEDKLIANEAKANNIPEEMQRRFQEQDNLLRSIAEERQREQILNAYTDLQKTCKLTNEQVYAFVQELQEKGYDMQKALPHLSDLYRGMHFTDLTQSMIDDAVQQALARQQKGEQQGTKPATKTGGVGASEEKIDSVASLDALLKDVKL
jgi:hypothetical protein